MKTLLSLRMLLVLLLASLVKLGFTKSKIAKEHVNLLQSEGFDPLIHGATLALNLSKVVLIEKRAGGFH